jgi:hypothetical protein
MGMKEALRLPVVVVVELLRCPERKPMVGVSVDTPVADQNARVDLAAGSVERIGHFPRK